MSEEFVSRLVNAPKVARTKSDLLEERSAFMRRVTRTSHAEAPTLDELKKHAEKFGTEMVVETAAELGYGLDSCINLMEFCDRANVADLKKYKPYAKAPKLKSAEDRCKELLGIVDEEEPVASS